MDEETECDFARTALATLDAIEPYLTGLPFPVLATILYSLQVDLLLSIEPHARRATFLHRHFCQIMAAVEAYEAKQAAEAAEAEENDGRREAEAAVV